MNAANWKCFTFCTKSSGWQPSEGDASFFVTGVDILTQWIEFKR